MSAVTEFVVIDANGIEIDWIDPVVEAMEQPTQWVVRNGYATYFIQKRPGRTFIQRTKAVES